MPTAAWLQEIHERLLAGDPTATAELFEALFEPLRQALTERNRRLDDDAFIDDAVTDALFAYVKAPGTFDPGKTELLSYLEMSAQGDLKNALAKRRRRWKRQTGLEVVELGARGGKKHTEDPDIVTTLEAERIRRRIVEHFDNPKDLEMAALIIDKERSTKVFAEILGIESLPIAEQRREVKRHKDRIKKQLKQLRERIRDEAR